ncbi:hypothetical protein KAI46_07570 [bacterium]|nr:hypothetical protein [bacterium]
MANPTFEKINYQVGKLCRLGSRKAKLMAISNRRKQQLRHLGERIYIFKTLQQDEDIWEKDEISQLMLTIADLDQEQEMLIDEINEIKAESPPEDLCSKSQEENLAPEADAEASVAQTPKTESKAAKVEVKTKPEAKLEIKKEEKKSAVTAEKKDTAAATKPKTPRKKATPSKSKAKTVKKDEA